MMRPNMANPPFDISIENHFSLFLVRLNSQTAVDWASENVQPDAQYFGDALVVEPRYVETLTASMTADGLRVR
jgi:hypothetical protein